MNYTPYATLTDEELVLDVCNDDTATTREIEMMLRIERLTEELELETSVPDMLHKEET